MDTRGRSGGFLVVDGDASLPGSACSSQGQGEDQEEDNEASNDMEIFDVLLTAAGQLLQEDEIDKQEKANMARQEFAAKKVVEDKEGSFQSNGALLEKPMWVRCDKHAWEENQSCKGKEVEDLSVVQNKITSKSSLLKKAEKSEYSMSQETPEDKDEVVKSSEGLVHSSVGLQNVENACSIRISRYMSIGECTQIGGVDNCEMSKTNHPSPAVPAADFSIAEDGLGNVHRLGEGKDERRDTCCKGWKKREEGSYMTVRDSFMDDENPLLVSSGSSEDDLSCVKAKLCETFPDHPLNKQLESRQVVARSMARDDDDNSSETFVADVALNRSLRKSISKALRARKLANGSARSKKSAAGLKRKHPELNKITNEKCGSLYGNGMACTQYQTSRRSRSKKKIFLGSTCVAPKLNVDINMSSLDLPNVNLNPPASAAKVCSAKSASLAYSPSSATNLSWNSADKNSDAHVEVRINSFTVPEFSVDLPETATVDNLKRVVMEAAINLLGGGLNVRVLLQGKKVPDEDATLVQLGMSRPERLESLGFMLEPNQVPDSLMGTEDSLLVLSCMSSQPTTRCTVFSLDVDANASTIHAQNGTTTALVKMDTGDSTTTQGHQVLKDEEALSLVQMQQNSHAIQVSKRRMRRPFTVSEVDTLIQAVEILGTGRWRDIKLLAFDQAKHRTYVDLKDKWKTLVHTAQIAPHQRRGKPVPQELLDRVIQAHTYWTTQQIKEQEGLVLY